MDCKGALVGYARVSTQEQDLSLQTDALAQAGCIRIFTDVASGARKARPGLEEALSFLRPSDTLLVWKIDRLGRSLPHLVQIVDDLRSRGIGFRSLTNEGIDTTSPNGVLIFRIFATLADYERELIRERTRAGMRAAAARGNKPGRRAVVTPEILAKAQKRIHQGCSVREAAASVKIGKTALYKALAKVSGPGK